jgi:hypothetical protein
VCILYALKVCTITLQTWIFVAYFVHHLQLFQTQYLWSYLYCPIFQASSVVQYSLSLFWYVTQHRLVFGYRLLGQPVALIFKGEGTSLNLTKLTDCFYEDLITCMACRFNWSLWQCSLLGTSGGWRNSWTFHMIDCKRRDIEVGNMSIVNTSRLRRHLVSDRH